MFEVAQRAVEEFNRVFKFPIATSPTTLSETRVKLRAKWMKEEIEEFERAKDIVGQVDATADLIYFALGVFVEMGINGSRVFELVHNANMAKLGADGQPLYDGEGKITKPANWVSPKEQIRQVLDTN